MVRVALDRGCQAPSGRYHKPGEVVDPAEFGTDQLEVLVRAGYLVRSEPLVEEDLEPEGRTGRVSPSIWILDPKPLHSLGVEELNVMVLERDSSIAPFDTAEEAVAWLSQHYEEPS